MIRPFVFLIVTLACCLPGMAAEESKKQPAPEQPVYDALDAMGKAYNGHDAKAVAACWDKDGVYTDRDTGEKVTGRDKLEAVYREIFKDSPKIEMSIDVQSVRFITADVAQVEAEVAVSNPEDEADEKTVDLVGVLKKVEGKWLLDSVQEADHPGAEKPSEHLEPLAWLVGHWTDKDSEEVDVHTEFRWSPKQAFLIRSFRVERKGKAEREGTQVFGWDPEKKQIRTWLFLSSGGFGEGTCEVGDGRVTMKIRGLLPDGRKGSLTQILTRKGSREMSSQFVAVAIDGQLQPTPQSVLMVREEAAEPEVESKPEAKTKAEAEPKSQSK
jgi:uncharacterized protein (TIGR02246 family)